MLVMEEGLMHLGAETHPTPPHPTPGDGCLSLSAIVENMAEFRPEMCTEAAQQGLLQWLLKRLKVREPAALPLTCLCPGCGCCQGVDGHCQPSVVYLGKFLDLLPLCCCDTPRPSCPRIFKFYF